jgi:hypothetical protein
MDNSSIQGAFEDFWDHAGAVEAKLELETELLLE